MTEGTTPFGRSTTVERVGHGSYTATVGPEMAFGGKLHGGLGLALAARAAAREVGDASLAIRSATALFVSPVPAGPVCAEVRVLRRGRSMAQCSVDIRTGEGEEPALSAVVALGRSRPGRALRERTAPDVPAPDDARSFQDPPTDAGPAPAWVFQLGWDSIERRIAAGHGWWDTDRPAGRSEGALWLRYRDVPRCDDEYVDPLAHIALSDMLGQALSDGLAAEDFAFVSIDHTVHLVGRTTDEWTLVTHRCEHLHDGYASLRGEVWDEHGTLLATTTQLGLVVDT